MKGHLSQEKTFHDDIDGQFFPEKFSKTKENNLKRIKIKIKIAYKSVVLLIAELVPTGLQAYENEEIPSDILRELNGK